MNTKRNRDTWVFWLTGVFVLVAISVFAFAIIRNQKRSTDTPVRISLAPEPRSTKLGEFRVVRVADGDSLTLVGSDGIELSIRLRGIDAPELGQPYGLESKEALQGMLASIPVTLDEPKKGKYGRYVANVFAGELWVNKEMVAGGHAWCDQVNAFDSVLYATEHEAKQRKLGLWSTHDSVPPWVWRAERK